MEKVNQYLLYLSGVINENQYIEALEGKNTIEDSKTDTAENKRILQRLTVKLGQKANSHLPLLRHISKNEEAAELFMELIKQLSTARASRVKSLVGKNDEKDNEEESSYNDINILTRRLEVKLGEKDANKFKPLIRHVSKNKNLLAEFERLIKELALLNPSKVNVIYKK